MRSLYVWIGVAALCTVLGAGWLGQKVLGQPDPSGLAPPNLPAPFEPPAPPNLAFPSSGVDKDTGIVQVSPGILEMPAPPAQAAPNLPAPQLNPDPQPNNQSNAIFQPAPNLAPPQASASQTFITPQDAQPGKIESNVTTEWIGPKLAKIGQPMACKILVRNNGAMTVHQVVVRHQMPDGVEQRGCEPAAAVEGRVLTWNVGSLEAGQGREIKLQLVSKLRGSLNCHAAVTFVNASTLQVQVREPLLVVKVKGPEKVITGEEATFLITLSNPGDGMTENIKVKAILPEGLEHAKGRSLEMGVAPLAPKEMRTMQLVCMARGSGQHAAKVSATAETNLTSSDVAMVEILQPKLDLAMAGPKLRYIDRHAVYTLKVSNSGSVPAANVTLTEVIPAGFKFHKASDSGQPDKDAHSVTWMVGDLQPGQNREMSLDLVAASPGEFKLVGLVNSARGFKTGAEVKTRIEGLSKLDVDVSDIDPVEVGEETVYQIRVVNRGTKMETNLQVNCQLPDQMEFVKGNMRHRLEGRNVVFDQLPNLAPLGEVIYTVTAKGMQPGNLRVRVQVRADSLTEPILREEVTRVYSDDAPAR